MYVVLLQYVHTRGIHVQRVLVSSSISSLLRRTSDASDSGSGSTSGSGSNSFLSDIEMNASDALFLIFRSMAAFVAIIIAIQICDVICVAFLARIAQLADHWIS